MVSGSSYVNEDIDHMAVASDGTVWWSAFAPGYLGDLVPSKASAGTESGERIYAAKRRREQCRGCRDWS
jgi:hypothetical protein